MNISEITSALSTEIEEQKAHLARLLDAYIALTGGKSPAAAGVAPQINTITSSAATKGRKAGSKNKKAPKTRKVGHAWAWTPAKNAAPWVQHVYNFLADGQGRLPDEVHAYITSQGVNVPRSKVINTLIWMRQSGRLMVENKKYRRKYFRGTKSGATEVVVSPSTMDLLHQPVNPADFGTLVGQLASAPDEAYLSVDHLPEHEKSEAVARLDALVAEGKLFKTVRAGQGIYLPAK